MRAEVAMAVAMAAAHVGCTHAVRRLAAGAQVPVVGPLIVAGAIIADIAAGPDAKPVCRYDAGDPPHTCPDAAPAAP